jgi:hypothetical protein
MKHCMTYKPNISHFPVIAPLPLKSRLSFELKVTNIVSNISLSLDRSANIIETKSQSPNTHFYTLGARLTHYLAVQQSIITH